MTNGRKTFCTPELTKKICAAIRTGLTYKDACLVAGISETSFYEWRSKGEQELARLNEKGARRRSSMQPYADFAESLKKAVPQRKLTLLNNIRKANAWQSDAWLLERLHYDEFGKRERIDIHDWRQALPDGVDPVAAEEVQAQFAAMLAEQMKQNADTN
jgi:hypothetical protein